MRILFLSHYFPPEVNAPANRTFEHCREWAQQGHEVHVVTAFPSHPGGTVYPGYSRSWYRQEEIAGIRVHRVWTYLAANRGLLRRILSYSSFVPSALWRSLRLGRFDVLLATSPHLLNAVAGWLAGGLKRTPWLFELRDLWPESIVAVGALRPSWALRALDRFVQALYLRATAIVCLTRSFTEHVAARGIAPEKICYVPNGVYPEDWTIAGESDHRWRSELGLQPHHLVVSYIGTLGMAHGLEAVLEAAERLEDRHPDLRFLLTGDGAQRETLVAAARERGLDNVLFTGQVPRSRVPRLMALTDISLVLLRDTPLFRTVLPSKMFEAMAASRPIILGVAGEARLVLEESGGGIAIPPGDAAALCRAVSKLAQDAELRRRLGEAGRRYVQEAFHRRRWALRYLEILERVARRETPAGCRQRARDADRQVS